MEDNLKPLEYYRKLFAESRDLLQDSRRESRIDDDYYHGYQLTREERTVLQQRGQPDGVFNRVRKAINGTLGVLKQGETDPRAYPRNPQDEAQAEIATKVLRWTADINRFDARRMDAAFDYFAPGTCAALITVQNGMPHYVEVNWEEFFYDPRSRKTDFRDARYMGLAKWMYGDDVVGLYADAEKDIDAAFSTDGHFDDTFADRPNDAFSSWIDRGHRRVLVIELYCRKGAKWVRTVFYAGGYLEQPAIVPFVAKRNGREESVCPIVAQSCYVDRDNNRYGIIRDMRAPQDEFNKRRQKLLHLLNNRQVRAVDPEYAFAEDAERVRKEASRPDGVLMPGWDTVSTSDMAAGQFNLLTLAEGEMDREGPNPAILARGGENASGRSQLVRQQAGLTEQAALFGGFEDWEHRVYEAFWDRAVQFMDKPQWIRITDDQGVNDFIQINEPVMGPPVVVMGPDGMPVIQPQVIGYKNRIAELDMDITLDTVPDTANLAQEQFMALVDLAKSGVPIPPNMLLEASSLPKKREIIEKMEGQGPDPMQQVAVEGAVAKVEETKSKTAKNMADAQATMAGIEMDAFQTGMGVAQG